MDTAKTIENLDKNFVFYIVQITLENVRMHQPTGMLHVSVSLLYLGERKPE